MLGYDHPQPIQRHHPPSPQPCKVHTYSHYFMWTLTTYMDNSYRSIFLSIPGFACLLDQNLRVKDANREFTESQLIELSMTGCDLSRFLLKEADKAYFEHSLNQQMFYSKITLDPMDLSTPSGSGL